jgi:hypothetical protein
MSWFLTCHKAMMAILFTLLGIGLVLGFTLPAFAEDLQALAKEANTAIAKDDV